MKLKLGFSPCPNDTFIFDAMVHGLIDTEGLSFDYFLADVEELNRRAMSGEVDITKLSFHAYAYAAPKYLILDSGSALGFGNGPLLVSRHKADERSVSSMKIAIPGKFTTANLLFSIAWPEAVNKKEYLFSDIVDAVLKGEVDAGLIIHETRFTYMEKGLYKNADMGEYWEKLTGLAIPLGTIVIGRNIPEDISGKVNRVLRRSIEYAMNSARTPSVFVSDNAREMDREVMRKHIELYVNDFTLSLGSRGREAVKKLLEYASVRKVIPPVPDTIFLDQK